MRIEMLIHVGRLQVIVVGIVIEIIGIQMVDVVIILSILRMVDV